MGQSKREVQESPVYQGVAEEIAYTLDTSEWGCEPTGLGVTISKYGVDCSSDCLSTDSPSASGNIITTPLVKNLEANKQYRLDIQFESSGNTFVAYCIIVGE